MVKAFQNMETRGKKVAQMHKKVVMTTKGIQKKVVDKNVVQKIKQKTVRIAPSPEIPLADTRILTWNLKPACEKSDNEW